MSIRHLQLKYTEFEKEWHLNLKDQAVNYAIGIQSNTTLPDDITAKLNVKSITKPPVPVIFAKVLAETITTEFISQFKYEIQNFIGSINEDIFIWPTLESKKEWILDQIKQIHLQISKHSFEGYISNYPKSLFSENILQSLYFEISPKCKQEILDIVSSRPELKTGFYHRNLVEDLHLLHYGNLLVLHLEVLRAKYLELSPEPILKEKSEEEINPYPLLFSSQLTYEFFMYCIGQYGDDRIKPALFAKYYLLFKKKGYIIGYRLSPYKEFVRKEFRMESGRIRNELRLNPEEEEFENFKLNFIKAKNIEFIN